MPTTVNGSRVRVDLELAQVALDRLPRAARGDPELLVVVAARAAGGEARRRASSRTPRRRRWRCPRTSRCPCRRRRRGRCRRSSSTRDVGRVDDLAVDEVVGDVEQRAHVGDVLALDLVAQLARVAGPLLEVEAALGALGDDLGVLGELRAHQAEDLGAVVLAIGPADAAARDPAAAQVDALHRGRVDVDLHQRRRLRDRRHVGGAQLERHRAAAAAVGVGAQGRLDQPELVAQDAVVVERLDLVEAGDDLLAQRRLGRLVARALGVEAQLEQVHELLGHARRCAPARRSGSSR